MLQGLRFPLLYIVEFGLYLPLLAGFCMCTSFIAATPIANLQLHGKSLPTSWEAAVFNHGRYLQGFIISNHPATFALGVVLTFGSVVAIYPVRLAQAEQVAKASATEARKFKVANIAIMVGLVITGLFLFTHVLVSVDPA